MAGWDYPTEEALQKIEEWPADDLRGLLEFLTAEWIEYGRAWCQDGREWIFATGGWSGNEELIAAFRSNFICFGMLWKMSERGGRHTFILPEDDE